MGKSRDCSRWVEMILMTESIVAEKDWSVKETVDCQKASAYAPMPASTAPIATFDKQTIIVKNLKRRKICVLSIRAVRNKTRVTHWSKSKFCGQGTEKKCLCGERILFITYHTQGRSSRWTRTYFGYLSISNAQRVSVWMIMFFVLGAGLLALKSWDC